MNKKAQDKQDRTARLAAVQAGQKASERRRNTLIFGGIGAAILAIIIAVTVVIVGQVRANNELSEAASQPIEGVQTFDGLSNKHTDADVKYEQTPGVGGDHNGRWLNCAVYTEPLPETYAVHSLEHGAVWITYLPDADQAEIDALTTLVGDRPYVMLSPHPDQASPVMASAWGLQLGVDSAADSRLEVFINKYAQGEQTPEPGAPCTGGVMP